MDNTTEELNSLVLSPLSKDKLAQLYKQVDSDTYTSAKLGMAIIDYTKRTS